MMDWMQAMWAAVALVVAVLAYDLLKRDRGVSRRDHDDLKSTVNANQADFESICRQWREKVGALDAEVEQIKRERENLVRDARNTIAGDLAVASDAMNRKGWR